MVKEKCKYCEKVFETVSDDQLKAQIAIHLVTVHKDKVEIKEVKKK